MSKTSLDRLINCKCTEISYFLLIIPGKFKYMYTKIQIKFLWLLNIVCSVSMGEESLKLVSVLLHVFENCKCVLNKDVFFVNTFPHVT